MLVAATCEPPVVPPPGIGSPVDPRADARAPPTSGIRQACVMGHRSRVHERSRVYPNSNSDTNERPNVTPALQTPPICPVPYGSTPKVSHGYLDPPQGPPSIGERPI